MSTYQQMTARLEGVLNEVVHADDRGYMSDRFLAQKQIEVSVEIARALVEISTSLKQLTDAYQEAHA